MLNPVEMNFYGTRNPESFENQEAVLVPNRTKSTLNQQNQSNFLEPNGAINQDASDDQNIKMWKKDGTGKWVNPDKGKRHKTEPYPNLPYLREGFCEDKSLPKSLQELFTPSKCNLCNCTLGSTATAKDHYVGKKHKINIKKWLLIHPEHYEDISEDYFEAPTKILDPSKLYCKYCDVVLSSDQQAEAHYLGKKHQNVINSGVPRNAYFNPAKGQWERFSKGTTDGRFGIGLAFLDKQVVGNATSLSQKLFCKVCQVACPSEITFNEHLAGAKHKKKIVLLSCSESSSVTKDDILEEVFQVGVKIPPDSDLSIYRTPTGKYYCQACNITVNSATQFIQHSESKKHRNKMIMKLPKQ